MTFPGNLMIARIRFNMPSLGMTKSFDNSFHQSRESSFYARVAQFSSLTWSNDDIQADRQVLSALTKYFSDCAFPFVSGDRISDLSPNGKSQSSFIQLIGNGLNDQNIVCSMSRTMIDRVKFRLLSNSTLFWEILGHGFTK